MGQRGKDTPKDKNLMHINGALPFVALWFILRGDLFYVLPCVI